MSGPRRPGGVPAPRRPGARGIDVVTRGTTAPNRLRRVDRWLIWRFGGLLRSAPDPLVVDLGFGASPVTTVELYERLRRVRADVEVLGVEIAAERVAAAWPLARGRLRFVRGGFDLPVDRGRRPVLVRAFNVLRQYPEADVVAAWERMTSALAPAGALVEGTCDEVGRRASWVQVGADGPRTLTLAARLGSLERPGELAERLPKALIHRNVPGEGIHAFLAALDRGWDRAAALAAYGARQRWAAAAGHAAADWPVLDRRRRWRLGEVTIAWSAVAPADGPDRPRVPPAASGGSRGASARRPLPPRHRDGYQGP